MTTPTSQSGLPALTRVDRERPPELPYTVLSLVAFHELEKHGLDAFLALNDGEGWMLPETLRLADYGLGHDERARVHQPVAPALGCASSTGSLPGRREELGRVRAPRRLWSRDAGERSNSDAGWRARLATSSPAPRTVSRRSRCEDQLAIRLSL